MACRPKQGFRFRLLPLTPALRRKHQGKGQDVMFLLTNALGQAVVIVSVQHWNSRLNQDRSGIVEVLGDQVNRATSKANAGPEGLSTPSSPLKLGSSDGWMLIRRLGKA